MAPKAVSREQLNERAQHFLKVLIERYIRDGQPVGSRTLARDAGLDLSPATIRNVMADLEDLGLVSSPHTSAGRVPTAHGLRLFVDTLMTLKPVGEREIETMRRQLNAKGEGQALVESASKMLSGITSMAGVVTLPRRERPSFRQIEFLPLSAGRILAILVTVDGEVHNRILSSHRHFSQTELGQAAKYLNSLFSGQDMEQVRERIVEELNEARHKMDEAMANAVAMAQAIVAFDAPSDDYVIAGQTNLMTFEELNSMARLRQLFDAFTEKREILHLLDECMRADGVQIFIGEESGYQLLDGYSVVTAPYTLNDRVVGVLGVIGPARMAYERVIPIVDVTARLLSAALKQ